MPITPEDKARQTIDALLNQAGWIVQNRKDANIDAGPGIAVREFSLGQSHGEADYLLFVNGQAVATGTDIKPLEIVMFMRSVKSRTMFVQMKGRGARTVTPTELRNVTPDGRSKDHFVIIDAVGLEPEKMEETQPLERKRNVSLEKLFELVTFGNRDADVLSSIASRLTRLDRHLTPNDRIAITDAAGGRALASIAGEIVATLDPDRHIDAARTLSAGAEPTEDHIVEARRQLIGDAAKSIAANPKLRNLIVAVKKSYEQIIDTVSQDQLLEAGPAEAIRDRALRMVQTFEQFLQTHKDEIEVLQILYSKPYAAGLSLKDVKSLAGILRKPIDGSLRATPDQLWHAYERLKPSLAETFGSYRNRLGSRESLRAIKHQQITPSIWAIFCEYPYLPRWLSRPRFRQPGGCNLAP